MNNGRKTTWYELSVSDPVIGTVFIHIEKQDRPLIVSKVEQGTIYRTDASGAVTIWGSLSDWRDEYRRRTISVIYEPNTLNTQ